jgi:hypothetical protein
MKRPAFNLTINGELIGDYASLSEVFRIIGQEKHQRTHRRSLKKNPILEIGNIKIESTNFITPKRK